mmetsp:Transcript_27977/g.39479  ORF Transcript_27977/g.39479 Transcript_27977/m.39479 type:complete len:689 (+) Transcript_27977:50-2116(+)
MDFFGHDEDTLAGDLAFNWGGDDIKPSGLDDALPSHGHDDMNLFRSPIFQPNTAPVLPMETKVKPEPPCGIKTEPSLGNPLYGPPAEFDECSELPHDPLSAFRITHPTPAHPNMMPQTNHPQQQLQQQQFQQQAHLPVPQPKAPQSANNCGTHAEKAAPKKRKPNSKSADSARTENPPDPNSNSGEDTLDAKQAKRQRRLMRNRESAQLSRERKKAYVKGLEDNVQVLTKANHDLTQQVLELTSENKKLKEQLGIHGGGSPVTFAQASSPGSLVSASDEYSSPNSPTTDDIDTASLPPQQQPYPPQHQRPAFTMGTVANYSSKNSTIFGRLGSSNPTRGMAMFAMVFSFGLFFRFAGIPLSIPQQPQLVTTGSYSLVGHEPAVFNNRKGKGAGRVLMSASESVPSPIAPALSSSSPPSSVSSQDRGSASEPPPSSKKLKLKRSAKHQSHAVILHQEASSAGVASPSIPHTHTHTQHTSNAKVFASAQEVLVASQLLQQQIHLITNALQTNKTVVLDSGPTSSFSPSDKSKAVGLYIPSNSPGSSYQPRREQALDPLLAYKKMLLNSSFQADPYSSYMFCPSAVHMRGSALLPNATSSVKNVHVAKRPVSDSSRGSKKSGKFERLQQREDEENPDRELSNLRLWIPTRSLLDSYPLLTKSLDNPHASGLTEMKCEVAHIHPLLARPLRP